MTGEAAMWPPWAWVVIIAILLGVFRSRRWGPRLRYRPEEMPRAIERDDPRVDELQARVAELENRLDFAERLLAGKDQSALRDAASGNS